MAGPSPDNVVIRIISRTKRWASIAVLLCTCGCLGFAWDEVLDGPYRLVAVDTHVDMVLCRSIGTEGDCVRDELPGPTVFQAGWNSKYIVVAVHPRRWPEAPNRSITHFYYIVRQPDEGNAARPVPVIGPLNEVEYQQEKGKLQLPEFSRVFNDLK
jgi:hypothetical protein